MSAQTAFDLNGYLGTLHAQEERVEDALRSAQRGMMFVIAGGLALSLIAASASAFIG